LSVFLAAARISATDIFFFSAIQDSHALKSWSTSDADRHCAGRKRPLAAASREGVPRPRTSFLKEKTIRDNFHKPALVLTHHHGKSTPEKFVDVLQFHGQISDATFPSALPLAASRAPPEND
jgi:hypothetical protein